MELRAAGPGGAGFTRRPADGTVPSAGRRSPTHTMNRIRQLLEPLEEEPPYGDFVVVAGPFGSACVTHETAREIERQLDRRWRPAWIAFRDRVGSRFRVRAGEIRAFVESTAAQRAAERGLDRARRREERADERTWEDE